MKECAATPGPRCDRRPTRRFCGFSAANMRRNLRRAYRLAIPVDFADNVI
ncbi:hypothetical protein L561_0955 [Bordetella pertussis STO1-CHOC-0019]|nr:hypothetical protein L561_0955 [Bordetella pertussis STO1-CHOC-0019]